MRHVPSRAIALSLGLALAGSTVALAQDAASVRSRPFMALQGEGKTKSRPELARLSAQVVTKASDLATASRNHATRAGKAAEVIATLKDRGVTVSESAFTMAMDQPTRPLVPVDPEGTPTKAQPAQAVATTRFDLEISPVDSLDIVVTALAASGVLEVRQVSYALRDDKAELNKARALAMRNAKEQALVYAEAGGFKVLGIVAVQDGQASIDQGNVQFEMGARAMGAVAAPMRSAPPATIDTNATVNVVWRIEDLEKGAGQTDAR